MMYDSLVVDIIKIVAGISAIALVFGLFIVPYFTAEDFLEYQECEVINVFPSSTRYGTVRSTVVVRLADGSLKKFDGNSVDFLMIKTGDFVTVKVSGKVGYPLQYRLFFEEVPA